MLFYYLKDDPQLQEVAISDDFYQIFATHGFRKQHFPGSLSLWVSAWLVFCPRLPMSTTRAVLGAVEGHRSPQLCGRHLCGLCHVQGPLRLARLSGVQCDSVWLGMTMTILYWAHMLLISTCRTDKNLLSLDLKDGLLYYTVYICIYIKWNNDHNGYICICKKISRHVHMCFALFALFHGRCPIRRFVSWMFVLPNFSQLTPGRPYQVPCSAVWGM